METTTETTTTEDAARVLYEEHAWSGCAGSSWGNLPDGARAGWEYAAGMLATAPRPDTTTEWGTANSAGETYIAANEAAARHSIKDSPRWTVVRREVTAWIEADRP